MKKVKLSKSILYMILIVWAVIQLFPLYYLFTFSLKTNAEILGENIIGLPRSWEWHNYIEVIQSSNILRYFSNSVLITLATIVFTIVTALMASYALYRMKWKLRGFFVIIFMLGLTIPLHSSILPVFLILKELHLLNSYQALILPYVAFGLSMAIMMFSGFLAGIPREMEEAACIDGCNVYKIFIRIITPLMKPAFATVAIFTYLSSWNELMFATIFVNDEGLKTLPVGIQALSMSLITDWGVLGAALVISLVPTILIYIFMSNKVQESMVMGAVKG